MTDCREVIHAERNEDHADNPPKFTFFFWFSTRSVVRITDRRTVIPAQCHAGLVFPEGDVVRMTDSKEVILA